MSRNIQTAYPCVNCKEEISPHAQFCQYCGAKQPDREKATVYNIFYRRKGGHPQFNMMFGGDMILELDDAVGAFYESAPHSSDYEHFVGAYSASSVPDDGGEMIITNWFQLGETDMEPDKGEQKILITFLE